MSANQLCRSAPIRCTGYRPRSIYRTREAACNPQLTNPLSRQRQQSSRHESPLAAVKPRIQDVLDQRFGMNFLGDGLLSAAGICLSDYEHENTSSLFISHARRSSRHNGFSVSPLSRLSCKSLATDSSPRSSETMSWALEPA